MSDLNDSDQVLSQPSVLSLDERVFKEVVHSLFMALPISTGANVVIGLSLISILWHSIDHFLLVK